MFNITNYRENDKIFYIHVIRVREEDNISRSNIYEDIVAKIFPKLTKDVKS
jgi:hypothetical protein